MEIRSFKTNDTFALIELFRKTVHTVCSQNYSQEQLEAWAPKEIDENKWTARFEQSFTLVAEDSRRVVGFVNLELDGGIDMFYVAADYQSRGVGKQLLGALEKEARHRGFEKLYSDVSLTARSFFLSKGFHVEKEYSKTVGSVVFPNAVMVKKLS